MKTPLISARAAARTVSAVAAAAASTCPETAAVRPSGQVTAAASCARPLPVSRARQRASGFGRSAARRLAGSPGRTLYDWIWRHSSARADREFSILHPRRELVAGQPRCQLSFSACLNSAQAHDWPTDRPAKKRPPPLNAFAGSPEPPEHTLTHVHSHTDTGAPVCECTQNLERLILASRRPRHLLGKGGATVKIERVELAPAGRCAAICRKMMRARLI
jgi:hypothetical protein